MNTKGFSLVNILIIVGLFFLGYLIYDDFFKKDNNIINQEVLVNNISEGLESSTSSEVIIKNNKNNNDVRFEDKNVQAVEDSKVIIQEKELEKPLEDLPKDNYQSGYYKNYTYNYEIRYPTDWPLRVRSEENISVGTVPPKNGQGAITIEIGEDASDEIDQLKKEASKYPGLLSLEESKMIISGFSGLKIVLENNIANKKDVYIIIEKNNISYVIKYSYESDSFIKQVEEYLKTFKFL